MGEIKRAYRWIPSSYLMQGLFFTFITETSIIFFKNLGLDNIKITILISLFSLPWLLKPLTVPWLERFQQKRNLLLTLSFCAAILILTLALHLFFYSIPIIILIFFITGFFASAYDATLDGFYINNLPIKSQAYFIGPRTLSYHFGRLISEGLMVYVVGFLLISHSIKLSWQCGFLLISSFALIVFLYHCFALPKESKVENNFHHNHRSIGFNKIYKELIKLPNFINVFIFTFFYNIAQNQLIKIIPLFFLDSTRNGGLSLTIKQISILNGFVSITALLSGIWLSGLMLQYKMIKQMLIPITLLLLVSNLGYVFLSFYLLQSMSIIGLVILFAQFCYGLANGIYMFCLLRMFGKGPYALSFYSIGTTIMVLSMLIAGASSGYILSILGYQNFFVWIFIINLLLVFYCYYLIRRKKFSENYFV